MITRVEFGIMGKDHQIVSGVHVQFDGITIIRHVQFGINYDYSVYIYVLVNWDDCPIYYGNIKQIFQTTNQIYIYIQYIYIITTRQSQWFSRG
jgi:hypothetical protein